MLNKCQLLCCTSIIMKHGVDVAISERGALNPVPRGHPGLGVFSPSSPTPGSGLVRWLPSQQSPVPTPASLGYGPTRKSISGGLSSTSPVQSSGLIVCCRRQGLVRQSSVVTAVLG